jgi:hypothetical protein
LMSEMDACFQQFFYTDSTHNFPLVKTPNLSGHPAEHGIMFDVVMAVCLHSKAKYSGRYPLPHEVHAGKRSGIVSKKSIVTIFILTRLNL